MVPQPPVTQTLADAAQSQPTLNEISDLYYLELGQKELDRQKRKSKPKKSKIGNPRSHSTMDDYFRGPETYEPEHPELRQSAVTKAADKPNKGINKEQTQGYPQPIVDLLAQRTRKLRITEKEVLNTISPLLLRISSFSPNKH